MKDLNFKFPLNKFEKFINYIGWDSLDEWFNYWNNKKNILSINKFWDNNVQEDWIWGLALPLLSKSYSLKTKSSKRKIIGLSALPGTGKTTLGKWLEEISLKLNFKIAVISIDDFYLPSQEMESAIKNNPWDVSRGFPGTHSVELMQEKISNWKLDGILNVPIFDKSLRYGLGDRYGWRKDDPDVLILEGWFLGVNPSNSSFNLLSEITPQLSSSESFFREKIQENLINYQEIWNLIDDIWHLKPLKFEYMNLWKSNQEKEMLRKKGNALKDIKLINFLRMLNVSIPHESFDEINSDVLLLINQERKLTDIKVNL